MDHRPFRNLLPWGLAFSGGMVQAALAAGPFTVAVMPDTQFYSRYQEASNYLGRENPFETQVRWIIENRATRNIAYTIHVGDIVDDSTEEGQWEYADATMRAFDEAMEPLDEAGVDYGVVRGNHDAYDGTSFLTWFGPGRFADKPTYRGSDPSGFNSYHVFVAEGRPFLVLLTDWRMDASELAWARGVLDAHPRVPTILVSHQILTAGDGSFLPPVNTPVETSNGALLWSELIEEHDQVFLTLNGHHCTSAWRTAPNGAGNDVLQVLTDYQCAFANGGGYLLEVEIDADAGRITGRTHSPWLAEARSDPGYTFPLPESVVPTEITVPSASFSVAMDFDERFCASLEACGLAEPLPRVVPMMPLAAGAILAVALAWIGARARRLRLPLRGGD